MEYVLPVARDDARKGGMDWMIGERGGSGLKKSLHFLRPRSLRGSVKFTKGTR